MGSLNTYCILLNIFVANGKHLLVELYDDTQGNQIKEIIPESHDYQMQAKFKGSQKWIEKLIINDYQLPCQVGP